MIRMIELPYVIYWTLQHPSLIWKETLKTIKALMSNYRQSIIIINRCMFLLSSVLSQRRPNNQSNQSEWLSREERWAIWLQGSPNWGNSRTADFNSQSFLLITAIVENSFSSSLILLLTMYKRNKKPLQHYKRREWNDQNSWSLHIGKLLTLQNTVSLPFLFPLFHKQN